MDIDGNSGNLKQNNVQGGASCRPLEEPSFPVGLSASSEVPPQLPLERWLQYTKWAGMNVLLLSCLIFAIQSTG